MLQVVLFSMQSGLFNVSSATPQWAMRLAVVNSLMNPVLSAVMCKPYRLAYAYTIKSLFSLCGCVMPATQDWGKRSFYKNFLNKNIEVGSLADPKR